MKARSSTSFVFFNICLIHLASGGLRNLRSKHRFSLTGTMLGNSSYLIVPWNSLDYCIVEQQLLTLISLDASIIEGWRGWGVDWNDFSERIKVTDLYS